MHSLDSPSVARNHGPLVRRCRRLLLLSVVSLAAGCTAQNNAELDCSELGPTVGEFATAEVGSVAGVVMSGDSAVFVLDGQSSVLWRSVRNAANSRLVARNGNGPAEVHSAQRLLSWVEGGVLVVEWDGSFLNFDANGDFVRRYSAVGARRAGDVVHRVNWIAADQEGRVYGYSFFERAISDSVHVVRCDLTASVACDTVEVVSRRFLDPPTPKRVVNQLARSKGTAVGVPSNRGLIAIARNGRRLMVSATTVQVLARSETSGERTTTALERISVPVSDADWESLVAADSVRSAKSIDVGLATAIKQGAKLSDIPIGLRTVIRAEVRPKEFPQLQDAPPIQSPNGTTWIERGHAPGSSYRLDRIDSLNRFACLRVPSRARILAIGTKIGVMARLDDDDVERLTAFKLP